MNISNEPPHKKHKLLKPLSYCFLTNSLNSIHKLYIMILAIAKGWIQYPPYPASLRKSSSKQMLNQQMPHKHDVNLVFQIVRE